MGIIFRKLENLRAVSKIHYPLICMPWMGKYIVIDGFGLTHLSFSDRRIPDLTDFTETLKKSERDLGLFMRVMDAGAEIFSNILGGDKEERGIRHLIGNAELLSLVKKLGGKECPPEEKESIIPPRISMEDCKKTVENVSGEWRRLKIEISMLEYTLRALNNGVNHHLEKLSRESEHVWREYRRRLSTIEREVNRRIRLMLREKEREIKKALNSYNKRANSIRREREKLERAIRRAKQTLERRGGGGLKRETSLHEKRIGELAKTIRNTMRLEEEILKERNKKIEEIEEKYSVLIAGEKERLKVLRESRDAELARINEESDKIREAHSAIIKQIRQLIEEKKKLVKMIEECAVPLEIDGPAVIGVPLYVAKYVRNSNKVRLEFYPPAKAPDPVEVFRGGRDRFMRISLRDRMAMFLNPLSHDLNSVILRNLKEAIRVDQHLNKKIELMIEYGNLLVKDDFMEILEAGLRRLEADGWISNQEINFILNFSRS